MRLDLAPVRTVPPRLDDGAPMWAAWIEVALLVRAEVPAWAWAESAWLHRAIAVAGEGRPGGTSVPFEPAARAASPGEPPLERRAGPPPRVGREEARALAAAVLASLRPEVHRHAELGLVSRLDEPAGEFRRRCLAPLRALLPGGGPPSADAAARVAALVRGIETVALGAGQLATEYARVGVAWYPVGSGPRPAESDAMLAGAARGQR
jgi:hypothetical protein